MHLNTRAEIIEIKGERMNCTNCGKSIEAESNWVEFPCPKCGKGTIVRCDKCKKLENPYKCPKCNFVGP
jgi:hypothetical protein